MFVPVVRDAWRQYRRRPLAAVITVAVGGLPVFLDPEDPVLAVPLAVVLLGAGLLVELFLISWLAAAIDPAPSPTPAAAALATMRRTIGPGIRAGLLRAFYLLGALMVGLLLFGSREGGPLPESEQTKLAVGLWPLFGVAFAFLAVLMQRVVLGGERRVRPARKPPMWAMLSMLALREAMNRLSSSTRSRFWRGAEPPWRRRRKK